MIASGGHVQAQTVPPLSVIPNLTAIAGRGSLLLSVAQPTFRVLFSRLRTLVDSSQAMSEDAVEREVLEREAVFLSTLDATQHLLQANWDRSLRILEQNPDFEDLLCDAAAVATGPNLFADRFSRKTNNSDTSLLKQNSMSKIIAFFVQIVGNGPPHLVRLTLARVESFSGVLRFSKVLFANPHVLDNFQANFTTYIATVLICSECKSATKNLVCVSLPSFARNCASAAQSNAPGHHAHQEKQLQSTVQPTSRRIPADASDVTWFGTVTCSARRRTGTFTSIFVERRIYLLGGRLLGARGNGTALLET
ncbi:hypothetical protein M427DRAFT_289328 [Gonapodya prolifera JEL478]|uniref:Uncharacterized protein n=1 Tax=Gonapodya prolifera (strain JEL478) TaxID=1344416 RepID=A0A139AIU1_GONPJ|nr:hypothetical protein M427DRAFT_289328 [Gonapodya prolifera JEL478]|eukprot:KXS16716.1 hypothetical protein M427DRAFT_289328 [Gonapodya prolifera JEL478]